MTSGSLMKGGKIAAIFGLTFAVGTSAAETVTLAPPIGVTTNVIQLFSNDTALEIEGPGTVKLNNANSHTGGTTLTGGTLLLSGNIPGGDHSPVGSGTFTVSGGTIRGSGTFGGNITGTGAATFAGDSTLAFCGTNSFTAGVAFSEGTVEISGGTTIFGDRIDLGNTANETATLRISGGTLTSAGNLQRGYVGNAGSVLIMTGGTFDVGGKNSVVGFNGGPVVARTDISGTASLRNIGNFYIHSNGGASSTNEVIIHDGGTIGFASFYDSASATTTLSVDGGTLLGEISGSPRDGVNWIKDSLNSFKIGPKGVLFSKASGSSAAVAQIRMPILAEAAGQGETAKGVTFDAGNWGYYVAGNAYEGPTVIKSGAALFLYSNGTIPSGSVVTVASGGELCVCGAADKPKTVSSLVLQNGAILGFGSSLNLLTASESITFPSSAKIALYNNANPTTGKKNTNGTYAVLKVPATYATALSDVHWSCATAASGKAYSFSVTTSGNWATLSMTIANDPNAGADSITGTSTLNADDYAVESDIVVNNSGTLVAKKNIYGSATGGSITINDGGTLDASAGLIRPVNVRDNSFQLHLNDGGNLIVNSIEGAQSLASESTSTPMFHFNGGTIYPSFAKKPSDGNRFLLNYQTALIGEHGVVIDMTRLQRPDGYTRWVRSSIQGNVNHDPNCDGVDGGITIRGVKGERAVAYIGNRFSGSTLTGGIRAEGGATVAIGGSALIGQAISFAPGSRLRPFNNTSSIQIGSLTLGKTEATEPVLFDGSDSMTNYNIVVSNALDVLSPVMFSVCGGWDEDSSPASGVYTALVYQASCSVDTSLFQLPAGSVGTLVASEVTLSGGDYDGWKALVVTIDNDIVVTGAAEYPSPKTVDSDVSCGSIVVGGSWNGVADPVCESSLTVSGNITASTGLYLGYNPAPGVDKDDWHQGFLTLNDGSITTPLLYSIYRPAMTNSNDSDCRFGCEATVNGGLLDVAGDVRLGFNRSRNGDNLYSRLTVNEGRVVVGGRFYLYYDNTQGAFTAPGSIVLNAGEVDVKGLIDMTRNASNPGNKAYAEKFGIWLNGGVLKAENIMMTATGATSPQLVFNGGIYMPYGAAAENRTMQDLNKAYVSTNGAVISTANIPAGETYTIAQNLLTYPALNGTADGGLCKIGAGTLALTGVNTFTGPTVVQEGTLFVANADALSSSVEVAGDAVLDLNGGSVSVSTITASGCVAGNLTVTNALVAAGDSFLSVEGDLEIAQSAKIDFGGVTPSSESRPVAVASGTISVPASAVRTRNAGEMNRCILTVVDGVLYAQPFSTGMFLLIK